MDLQLINKIAKENMAGRRSHLDREPGYIYDHGIRTANLSAEIMAKAGGERRESDPVLYTGALFHDVGKGFAAHHEAGAELVKQLLSEQCTPEGLSRISDIVRFHCIRKQGLDLDSEILAVQDADMIDHFGTQEIWLSVYYQAYSHGNQRDVIEYWETDDFRKRTERLRGLLNFDISRALFDDRVEFQEAFLTRFKQESEGKLPDTI